MSFIILAILGALYFLPLIVASMRSHRNILSIALLNLFLGWTVVGWVVALVWSAAAAPAPVVIYRERGQ